MATAVFLAFKAQKHFFSSFFAPTQPTSTNPIQPVNEKSRVQTTLALLFLKRDVY